VRFSRRGGADAEYPQSRLLDGHGVIVGEIQVRVESKAGAGRDVHRAENALRDHRVSVAHESPAFGGGEKRKLCRVHRHMVTRASPKNISASEIGDAEE
jgi:hypothetical protein